jgi:putative ATPase
MLATSKIGYPESRILLGQCVIYLASCPKSNASYQAINQVLDSIQNGKILEIPEHLKDSALNYKYPHDFGGYVEQEYLKENIGYYKSHGIGFEKTLNEWLEKIKQKN